MIRTEDLCYTVKSNSDSTPKTVTYKPHSHDDLHILNHVNLSVKAGSSVAIVGASGSGKSSLLGMLAGLDTPSSGKIFIDNMDISDYDEEQRAKVRSLYVAFVFQNFQLLPSLNALENVALPLEIKDDKNATHKASKYLSDLGLQNRTHHLPSQLSGGEQQRVALARAFACEAPIIFADEPTGNLDSITGEKITDLLFTMNQEKNTTLILVTHSNELAQRCDRQLEMKAGQLREISNLHP